MTPTSVLNDLRLISQYHAIDNRMTAVTQALNWPDDVMQDTCTWLIDNTSTDTWGDVIKELDQ